MRHPRPLCLAALAVLVASPAFAIDVKRVGPGASCAALAPDSAPSELHFSANGVYNPGTTTEKVICAIPYDQQAPWDGTAPATVKVYYRVLGAAAGRVVCTLVAGSTNLSSTAVGTTTGTGALVSGGERESFTLVADAPNHPEAPSTLICSLSPKTALGAIVVYEGVTQ